MKTKRLPFVRSRFKDTSHALLKRPLTRTGLLGAICATGLLWSALLQPGWCASGQLDSSFSAALNGTVSSCAVHPTSGKIIVGGAFSQVGAVARKGIAALNSDGSLDTSFYAYPALSGSVTCFAIQPDGKIIFGEQLSSKSGFYPSRVARLLANGTLDASFSIINFNDRVKSIAIQVGAGDPAQEGRILVGGDYTASGAVTRNYLARFLTDGTLDSSFNPNPNGPVNAIACDSASIALGGEFTAIAGATHNFFGWLFLNGSYHNLNGGTSSPEANSDVSAVQLDGINAYIGGVFTTFKGQSRVKVAHIDNYGVLGSMGCCDPVLPPTTAQVLAIAGPSNAKYAVGTFSFTWLGTTYQHVIRYSGASQDLTFAAGSINGYVDAVFVQADNNVLIGGTFTSVQGQTRNYIARLLP